MTSASPLAWPEQGGSCKRLAVAEGPRPGVGAPGLGRPLRARLRPCAQLLLSSPCTLDLHGPNLRSCTPSPAPHFHEESPQGTDEVRGGVLRRVSFTPWPALGLLREPRKGVAGFQLINPGKCYGL